jgi:hypothetical protein
MVCLWAYLLVCPSDYYLSLLSNDFVIEFRRIANHLLSSVTVFTELE